MDLHRCKNGHFYDGEKFSKCPHCTHNIFDNIPPSVRKYEPIDGKWKFVSLIGEGAFGKVYKLIDSSNTNNFSALKIISIRKNNLSEKNYSQLIDNELSTINLMYQLNDNKNIVRLINHFVSERGDKQGCDILLHMELLTPLNNFLLNTPINENNVIDLAIDICSALVSCQKLDIIHGDIKPENIFITSDGNYKLGDFGNAMILNNSEKREKRKGTRYYCAPEVYNGEEYTLSSDIYSLGIVLYKLLNNNELPPFSDTAAFVEDNRKQRTVPAPQFGSSPFVNIVMKACSFRKEDRYQSAFEMMEALKAVGHMEGFANNILNIVPFHPNVQMTSIITSVFSDDITAILSIPENTFSHATNNDIFNTNFEPVQPSSNNPTTKKIATKMINWFCFTCFFSLMPLFIFIIFYNVFFTTVTLTNKCISEFLYFALTISVITIREMVTFKLWKKEQNIYLIALFIMLVILILSAIFFGVMTMKEMNLIQSNIKDRILLISSIILSISSFITGTFIQIWEAM